MKTAIHFRPSSSARSGFSLFEVLMFLSVVGVMLGITVPMLTQSDAIYAARDRRNAQELASTSVMAQTAGLNFVEGENVLATVRAIVRGGMSASGAMKGRVFVVPGLSEEDIKGAAKYLHIQNGELRYTSSEAPLPPGDQRL